MMKYDLDELRDMAPLYIQGTLPEAEKEAFQEGLKQYPQLQDDLDTYSAIGSYYQGIEKKITPPTERAFDSIQQNINRDHVQPIAENGLPARIGQMKEWLSELFTVPKLGWGIAAVQCALIVFLLLPNQRETSYETLSSSKPAVAGQITIQLVFDEKTTEKEIRRILNAINAEITGGPSTEGMYQIGLLQNSDADLIIKDLRQNKSVFFAERAL